MEVRQEHADRRVARIARDAHERRVGQHRGDRGDQPPHVQRLVEGHRGARASARERAGEVLRRDALRVGFGQVAQLGRPKPEADQRFVDRKRTFVLADAADLRMAVEHLLEQRRAAAGHSHDKRGARGLRALGREPRAALLDQSHLLGHVGLDGADIERRRRLAVHEARELERLAVLAVCVEHAHRLEARDPLEQRAARAARGGLELRHRRGAVTPHRRTRGEHRSALVLGPASALVDERVELVLAAGAVQCFGERERRFGFIRWLARNQRGQPRDRCVALSEPMLDDALEQVELRVGRCDAKTAFRRVVRTRQAPGGNARARDCPISADIFWCLDHHALCKRKCLRITPLRNKVVDLCEICGLCGS